MINSLSSFLFPAPARSGPTASLDGLRGLAVLMVFFTHATAAGMHPLGAPLLSEGKRGVWIFFALSSYLLASPFFRKGWDAFSPYRLGGYAAKRVLRVYPLFFVVVAASVATTVWLRPISGVAFPYQLTPTEGWRHLSLQEAYIILWSVAVEMKFYLVLPLAAGLALALPRIAAVAALLAGIFASAAFWPWATAASEDMRLGVYLPVFLAGVLWAYLGREYDRLRWADDPRARRAVAWTGAAGLLSILLATGWVRHRVPLAVDWHHALESSLPLSGLLVGGIVAALARSRSTLSAWLLWRPLRSLGVLCFGVYLLHFPCLIWCEFVANQFGFPLQVAGAIAFGASWAMAACSFAWIERPFMALADQSGRPGPVNATQPVNGPQGA